MNSMDLATEKVSVLMVGGFPAGGVPKVYGGQVTACLRLLESSFAKDYRVRTLDTTQISNPPPGFLVRLIFAVRRMITFIAMMLRQRPDVVIIFLGDGASAVEKGVMARFARALGVPSMVFPRAGGLIGRYASSRWYAALIRETVGRSNVFLCQGVSFQKFAMQELGFTRACAPVIPNWTALEDHLNIGAQRDYALASDCPHVLFLGWLEEAKGVLELLEAVRILRDEGLSFHLTIGGDGTALPQARQFVNQHGLGDKVNLYGWVGADQKSSLLSASQIFVLPSWSEGFPNAMIEAMSAGLACLVTDVGMISDYVVGGRDALVVEPKNIGQITEALRSLICDQSLRERIAKSGFQLARSHFTLENGARLLADQVEKARGTREIGS